MVGTKFDLGSTVSISLLAGGLGLVVTAVLVEALVREPIIPLTIFRNRTVAVIASSSVLVDASFYGVTVFLSQY